MGQIIFVAAVLDDPCCGTHTFYDACTKVYLEGNVLKQIIQSELIVTNIHELKCPEGGKNS